MIPRPIFINYLIGFLTQSVCLKGPKMIKLLAFMIFIVSSISFAYAVDRPSTGDMTCRQVAALVKSQGAVVLSTGNGLYNRYVKSAAYCERDQLTVPAWVPTRDSARCFVGYTCEERPGNSAD